MSEKMTGLALMRAPFPANLISKLPKPTKAQTEEVRADFKRGVRCEICGTWHHPKVVHVDYVGHAALTDRLLDCDPGWQWGPLAFDAQGFPALDATGGMWIRLTVCGVTRLGYGDAQGKQGGDAVKERIGDALRNAAMRFGAALDLWHKGDLHVDGGRDGGEEKEGTTPYQPVVHLLPAYTGEQFAANVEAWRSAIDAGKKTPDAIIDMVGRKYTLTDAQRSDIRALVAHPVTTYAQVSDAIHYAGDLETLDLKSDLIRHVADAGQRDELTSMYRAMRAKMEDMP